MAGALVMAIHAGLNFYGFSVFFVPLISEFGWSRGVLSAVFSLSRLEGGLLGPVEGYFTDKFGPRRVMLVGIPLMALGFILFSRVNSLLSLYLVYILAIAVGSGLGSFTPVGAAAANWFRRKRSRAFGIVMSGVALGGATIVPLLGWWISTYGWRNAAVAAGVLILAAGVPIALIMRHRPEDYGYLPDGAGPASHGDTFRGETRVTEGTTPATGQAEFSAVQSLKTSAFWFLGISQALRSVVTTGFIIHFVAMMVDRGFSLSVASSLLGSVALLSLIGRLGLAWLGDLVDKRYMLAAAMGAMALAMLGLSQVQGFSLVLVILLVYSISYGGATVLSVALQADYFGRHAFGTIRGLLNTVQTVGMVLGPIFAGFVYDATESYFLAFVGFAVAAFLATLSLVGLRRPVTQPAVPTGVRQV